MHYFFPIIRVNTYEKEKKKKKIIVNNVCQQCGESIPFVIRMGTGCTLTSMLDFSMWLIRLWNGQCEDLASLWVHKRTSCTSSNLEPVCESKICFWWLLIMYQWAVYRVKEFISWSELLDVTKVPQLSVSFYACFCRFVWNSFRKQLFNVILLLICIYDYFSQ